MSWLIAIAPAWLSGSLLALLSAPLGCLLLWRRMAFFADALAHGALFGVALAMWWQLPLALGILSVVLLVVLGLTVLSDARLPNDALLAGMTVTLLSLGLLTLTQLSADQNRVLDLLFGDLLVLSWHDLPLLAGSVLVGLLILYKLWPIQLQLATSEVLARTQGIHPARQRLFFMGLLAGFCAIALQAVGSLLVSGLLILPALGARLWSQSPKQMVWLASLLAQLGVLVGVGASAWLHIQTGLGVVLALAGEFLVGFMLAKWQR